ncbi:protein abrupt-like isoform X2 [Cimex lectularius]|uniref:Abrupt n=1 Tax=Cimex lectularius TaxID=79782 RepID=A0A7E4SA10_CIMLE|nr:protein abrupt-like isoform X2 [Cimex lectularius]
MMGGLGGSEQQYSLRWNDFHSSILSSFRHLRDEEDFVDVTLACDGCSFTAHKVVLSACSPYFRTLLKANPCQHPIVILRDVREQDMEALLRFMYNGEVHIGQEQLSDFLKTAQTLQVRGLADVPAKEQQKLLTGSNPTVPWANNNNNESNVSSIVQNPSDGGASPPPSKRSRSSELAQNSVIGNRFSPSPASSLNTNNHHHHSEARESLLSQALESTHNSVSSNNQPKGNSDSSVHAQSTGEESNSSDTGLSERGAVSDRGLSISTMNGPHSMADLIQPKTEPSEYGDHHNSLVMDPNRTPNFSAALLGLQGLPGLLPGPSGMHNSGPDNSFVSRRGLDMMRVRATDPRPCPKCGKIYRSAHTLRTHLEDKHTVCPGYRCVLCGTVAKSRNSLHSHMSRQHRGISTKDLPVLPMPSPFDPELASRLLAKAGVKVSAAELRARASPTGPPRRPEVRLELKSSDDPEDLTVHNNHSTPASRFCSVDIRPLSPPIRHPMSSPPPPQMPPHHNNKDPRGPSTGSAILDTYLQFIAENSAGLHLSAEQAAKMAAKVSEEQRRMALMDDRGVEESSEPEDDFSEEEHEPEPIKAE